MVRVPHPKPPTLGTIQWRGAQGLEGGAAGARLCGKGRRHYMVDILSSGCSVEVAWATAIKKVGSIKKGWHDW